MMPIVWDDMRQDWGSADLPYISMISLLRFTSFRIAICR